MTDRYNIGTHCFFSHCSLEETLLDGQENKQLFQLGTLSEHDIRQLR